MIDRLYRNVQYLKHHNIGIWKYVYKINKLLINILYPLKARFAGNRGTDESSDIVVSLTTYPARIKTVWVTIATLLNQTYKPQRVILWLSKDQFREDGEDLPYSLVKLKKWGLEIRYVDGDLKPHKKYYYAFRECWDITDDKSITDSLSGSSVRIVTADDDIFYPERFIEHMAEASDRYPDAVICSWSHKIAFDRSGDNEALNGSQIQFADYNSWEDNATDKPDIMTMPVGCNGVLYKKEFFDAKLYDTDNISRYALYTDDLWLKVMEVRNGIKAYNYSNEPLIYYNNIYTMKSGMWHSNAQSDDNRNDRVWNELMEVYSDAKKLLISSES